MLFYEKQHLHELFQAFHTLTGIGVGVLYPNAQVLLIYPELNEHNLFCSIVRTNPEVNRKCLDCDLIHMEKCKKMKTTLVYTCHMGLTEVLAPIIINDIVLCYITFGQFIIEDFYESSKLLIQNNTKDFGFDDNLINKAIDNLNFISSSKLKASIKMFEAVILQIFSTKLIRITKINFINHLDTFIESQISKKINVKDIAEHFQISRTSLYDYSKKYLDCGLSEYVLNKKINHAKKILLNSTIKICELSDTLGFSDYNYFSRVFKKKAGVSPSAFRQGIMIN